MSGGGGGAGGGLITDENARLLVEDGVGGPEDESTALRDLPLLDWSTDADLSTSYTAGSSMGVTWTPYTISWGRYGNVYSALTMYAGDNDYIGPGDSYGPTILTPGEKWHSVASVAGAHNQSWPTTPGIFGCGIGGGSYSGWEERERWFRATVPAHPADMAGITVSANLVALWYYPAKPAYVRVSSTMPTAGRQGVVVATINSGTTTVYIPAAYIPDEGEDIWIGITPGWQARVRPHGVQARWLSGCLRCRLRRT